MTVRPLALAALCALSLGGCSTDSSARRSLGLVQDPPDEFLVVARRPLEMPGSLSTLPAPTPGAPSRVEPDPAVEARAALLGETAAAAPAPSRGEAALVAAAGPADPSVRDTLVAEDQPGERRFGLSSFFGVPIEQDPTAAAERLTPEEEAERLRAEGLPAPAAPAPPPEEE